MKFSLSLRETLYRLRTEGGSPRCIAWAVAWGVYIGCSPFYGLHLILCLLVAKIFRLNRMLTYLAAHISLPGVFPFLCLAQVQIARRLRGLPYLSLRPQDLRHVSLKQFGGDLLLGSFVVGVVLAAAFAVPAYFIARRRSRYPEVNALLEATAYRYLGAGLFHWELVRGKLRHDPVYFHLLRAGVLTDGERLLDLGCGRGILFSLLSTAGERAARGDYPAGWAPPPRPAALFGIEARPKTAAAARLALGPEAHIEIADLQQAELPPADVVLLLDVLHYLPAAAQEGLLARVAALLPPGGLLLIREVDAAAGWRFLATRLQERLTALARRHFRQRFRYRSRAEWRRLLEGLGFMIEDEPMAAGTPYANVLIQARRAAQTTAILNEP